MTRWQHPHPIDELEHAIGIIKASESELNTLEDLDRLRRATSLLDMIGGRIEWKLK